MIIKIMKYKVLVNNRFGEGWQEGDIIEMDDNAAKIPLEEGSIEPVGGKKSIKEKYGVVIPPISIPPKPIEKSDEKIESSSLIRYGDNIFQSIKDLMLFFNLFDAKIILYKMGLDFWLENGTLLGYYREGKFIENDTDIDLGLFDFKEGIVEEFKKKGFELYKEYGDKKTGLQYSLIRNGYKLDLFFFKKKRDGYYQYVWGENKYSYKFPKFTLKKARFYGMEFNIPHDTEKHLEAQYGDWKEPKPEWDYINDPKNICQE